MLLKNAIVFLFGFSLFVVMLNSSGLFSVQLQHQNLSTPTVANVTDLTSTPAKASGGVEGVVTGLIKGGAEIAFSVFYALFGSLLSVLGVTPILKAYGIPVYMVTMLAGMLSLIAVLGLIMLFANRSDKGIS